MMIVSLNGKMKEVLLMFLMNKYLHCLKRNKNLKSQYFVFSNPLQNLILAKSKKTAFFIFEIAKNLYD